MDLFARRELDQWKDILGFYFGRVLSRPLVPPEHVYFNLTNRCNLRCKMCDIPGIQSNSSQELSVEELKNIIDQIKDLGVRHIIFSGGEPFLKEGLFEIVSYAVERGIEMVDIITNGTQLDDAKCEEVVKLKVNNVSFSLDGLKEKNDFIRGPGVFEKVKSNIEKLNQYKSVYNTFFPTLIINCTVMGPNIADIVPLVEFAREHKSSILFQPLLANNTKMYEEAKDDLWPSSKDIDSLKSVWKKVLSLKSEFKEINIFTDSVILYAMPAYFKGKKVFKRFNCYEAIKRIVISYDGVLWSCFGVYGNLKNKSLKELWLCAKARKIRENAKACKSFCMQDCIYFPTDIVGQVKGYLKKVSSRPQIEKDEVKAGLLERLEALEGVLQTEIKESKVGAFGFWETCGLKRASGRLKLLRKKIESLR